jgi:5-methylcytosine-specific restriction endonuclease McrA
MPFLNIKWGTCKGCGRHRQIVNRTHYLCVLCNRKRLDALKPYYPKQSKADLREQIAEDRKFYDSVAKSRPHICAYCGDRLFGHLRTYNFDHILPKSKFPTLRHEKDNIALTCFTCHQTKTSERYTDTMRQLIMHTVRLFVKSGHLVEIGLPNVNRLKDWIMEDVKEGE